MGCDIHTRAEVRVTDRETGAETWKMVKRAVFPNPYFRPDEPITGVGFGWNTPTDSRPYAGRNYELFSVLADVRNNRQTHNIFDPSMRYEERDALAPIADPRGIPEDASKGWLKECRRWGVDFHSHSYFTLAELEQAVADGAFSQRVTQRGYVPAHQFLAFKEEGTEPDSWSSYSSNGVTEEGWLALTADERTTAVEASKAAPWGMGGTMVALTWVRDISGGMREFVEGTIPALASLAPYLGDHPGHDKIRANNGVDPRPRNHHVVRMVFAFDN